MTTMLISHNRKKASFQANPKFIPRVNEWVDCGEIEGELFGGRVISIKVTPEVPFGTISTNHR